MAFTPDSADVLLTFAEVSVAFAGFSSIVAVFQQRTRDDEAPFDLFRFLIMLEFSLASLLFALIPFPLHFAGLPESAVWTSSGAMMISFIVAHVFSLSLLRRRTPEFFAASVTRPITVVALVIYGAVLISQILNIANVGFHRSFGPYLFGLLLLVFTAAANFARLVWVGNAPLAR